MWRGRLRTLSSVMLLNRPFLRLDTHQSRARLRSSTAAACPTQTTRGVWNWPSKSFNIEVFRKHIEILTREYFIFLLCLSAFLPFLYLGSDWLGAASHERANCACSLSPWKHFSIHFFSTRFCVNVAFYTGIQSGMHDFLKVWKLSVYRLVCVHGAVISVKF